MTIKRISPLMRSILQKLLDAKRDEEPFIHLWERRATLIRMAKAGWIFGSNGIDGRRYTITRLGEKMLGVDLRELRYFWNGRGYPTIEAMAEAEGMTFSQARYRHRRKYTHSEQLRNNQPVIVDNRLFANTKEAAEALGRTPKSIRRSLKRAKSRRSNTGMNAVAIKRKLKAFKRILGDINHETETE